MMEQSKLSSIVIAKLKIAYPYFFKDLTTEEFAEMIAMYQEELGNLQPSILLLAIKQIIRTSKYMPSLADIIYEYQNQCKETYIKLIEHSDIEDKKYAKEMIEWFYLKENFPNNLPDEIKSKINGLVQLAIDTKRTQMIESRS